MRRFVVNENQTFSTRRLESLSDGVFAIAMTLLVLDLNPRALGSDQTSAQLWHALASDGNSILSFVISFLLLGSLWAVHMRQFEYIKKANRHLTMINTLRLLMVVLIPLTTSIAGRYSDLVLGRVLLPLNFFLLVVISGWEWGYAIHSKVSLQEGLPPDVKRSSDIRNKTMQILSALVVIASIWVGDPAFLLLFLIGPVMRLLARWES